MERSKGMSTGRLGFGVALLLAALVGGLYFADWLALWIIGLKGAPLAWNTWWQYFQVKDLPQYAPYAGKITLAAAIGFGLPLLAWAIALIPLFNGKSESLHGEASFANLTDLKKAGLLKQTPQSILIGKYKGHLLWLNGALHLIVICPTRSGKTTSIAIPVLLTYAQSMVVSDLKGELRKLTSGQRLAMGQRVYVWAPYDVDGRTHRFNPFTLLAGSDPGTRIGEIQTIAAILYPDNRARTCYGRVRVVPRSPPSRPSCSSRGSSGGAGACCPIPTPRRTIRASSASCGSRRAGMARPPWSYCSRS
jgi:type IV secretion system protein VirD4